MTSTINASTSSGIVQTADTSGALALQSNGTTALTVGPGYAISTTNTINTPGVSLGFKNRIINGAGQIWQRGTTISSIPTTGTTATYGPDRWCFGVGNTGFTAIAQAVQVSGGGIRVNCTTSGTPSNTGDVFGLRQIIEGLNCYDLAGQKVTVSFQVKTNKTGNYGVFLYDYTGTAYGTPQSITVSSSGVTTSYSLTFDAPAAITASTSAGIGFNITLAANASRAGTWYPSAGSQVNLMDSTSNYFEIYNIQLEVGTAATSFEFRDYGRELLMCQRYFSSGFEIGTAPANNVGNSIYTTFSAYNSDTGWIPWISFPVQMRSSPTVTLYRADAGATNGQWASYDGGYTSFTSSSPSATTVGFMISGTRSGGFASYRSYPCRGNYTASAEL